MLTSPHVLTGRRLFCNITHCNLSLIVSKEKPCTHLEIISYENDKAITLATAEPSNIVQV